MSLLEEIEVLNPRNTTYVGPAIEIPTPHKVAVLILVQQYLKVKKTSSEAGVIFSSVSRRHFCMLLLKLIQYPDMSYNELYNLLTSKRFEIDVLHLDGFVRAISNMFSSGIETLFDFAEWQNIEKMLSEQLGVSQFSVVGMYIRRVGVILECMSFPEMMLLYKNICLYYEKGIRALAIRARKTAKEISKFGSSRYSSKNKDKCGMTELAKASVMDTETVYMERNLHSKWSPKQADLFVTQQSHLLETNELRTLKPIDMQKTINEIIQDNPLHAHTYFLAYMNQIRLRDYFGALDALHRSFDRSPMEMLGQEDQKGIQYYCVNLAVLHATFKHRREALESLKECIMLAQENSDKRCLDMANSWYCLLNSTRMDPFEKSLPDIQDPGLVQSLSLAIQFVVKFGAQCGYLPLDLFELLTKSDELNCKNSILEHYSDSLSLRSSLWCLYGRHELSSLYAQFLLNLKKVWAFGDVGNSESVGKVLASQALWLHVQGEHQLSYAVLHHARMRFPRYPHASNWMVSGCHITIQNAIQCKRWNDAHLGCCQLYQYDKISSNLYRAAIHISRGSFHTGHEILINLLYSTDLDVMQHVRVLVMLAYSTMSQNHLSSETIEHLTLASTIASTSYLEYEEAMVDLALAQMLLRLNMPKKAYQSINNCIDKISINGGVFDRAKANFVFIRCLYETLKTDESKVACMKRSLPTLDKSAEIFKRLKAHAKVLDVYIFTATCFHKIGDMTNRNEYARLFKDYYKCFPVNRDYLGLEY